uniref:Uncharacterized protein n=1 Tax=Magallana gigas TaxID=29159 RepID=A0A8W8P3I4_MAGGI
MADANMAVESRVDEKAAKRRKKVPNKENQKKQDGRMAKIENMCCGYQYQDDYNDYGDFNDYPGTSGERYKTASRKRASEDVDTCTDNGYANGGRKLKVKKTCDKPIDDELANLVTDWFRANRLNFSRSTLYVWDSTQ